MPTIAKWILSGAGILLALFAALMISVGYYHKHGPPGREHREREAVLAPLLPQHASMQQVTQALAFEFMDYSRNGTNHAALNEWLSREPSTSFVRVREGAVRYPIILFHTTTWTMTWLFFDSEGRLQDYYLCAQ